MQGEPGEPDEVARQNEADEEFGPRRRAWVRPVAWIAIVGLVLGAGFSSALALLAGQAAGRGPDREATAVSAPIEERGTGSGVVAIQTPPEGATSLAVRLTCLSAGEFSWGTANGGTATLSCSDGEVGSGVWSEFALPDSPELDVVADRDAQWAVVVVYLGDPAEEAQSL